MRTLGSAGGVAVVVTAALVGGGAAARAGDDDAGGGQWWKPPSDVRRMLGDIDAGNLRSDDLALVGFGTRHTLSSQDDPQRGIGAARDWIKSQFDRDAATSDGRMTVELQSYVQPPASRVPAPTTITNVGRDPARHRSEVNRPRCTS